MPYTVGLMLPATCTMLAAMQHGPGPPGDLLERSVPYRDRPRGCTLKMSPSDLASRRYDRLWGSEEHFQEWLNIGGDVVI